MGALVELGNVLSNGGTTDTGVAVDVEVVTEGDDDLLDLLGELTGGGEDKSLGLLDGGVDLSVSPRVLVDGARWRRLTRWRIEMEKVAVFPVPDWAWAMQSRPVMMGMIARCWMAEGRSKP